MRNAKSIIATTALIVAGACAPDTLVPDDYVKSEDGKADSSAIATILDFDFDGQLVTDSATASGARQIIQDQLLYTIGHLNAERAVGRLDRLEVTNVKVTNEGGKSKVTYHARMPVAWGSKTNLPTKYDFIMPRDVSWTGQDAFTTKYKGSCVEWGAHDVDSGSMWYYYRPRKSGCAVADEDSFKWTATVTVSAVNTTGKYPEYNKVWEDNAFKIVAVFGKYEDGATETSDAGISAFNEFVAAVKTKLGAYQVTTVPATVPTSPGVSAPDIEWVATLPGGKTIQINALLVDNIASATPAFYDRYEGLSTRADIIAYNGHAGLGQNVRAIARKGRWAAGQYLIMFMNGCDTYAYVDGYMAQTRAAYNTDDPSGTKYMDIVVNAMPAFFASDSEATMALVGGLLATDTPKTYEQIFKNIDSSQIVLVTGEQDNTYVPGGGGGGTFTPISETSLVAQGETVEFKAENAPAGNYSVVMSHDSANPGGDADMFVRVGSAPTTTAYDCRPYETGSDETCQVTLAAAATIYIHVNGYGAGENHFVLNVTQTGGVTPPPVDTWTGMDESGTVAKGAQKTYATPSLKAGSYLFEMTGTGDADLYVRVGTAPTTQLYDCRPYKSSSNETCTVQLNTAAPVHLMVNGYAATSNFRLVGRPN